MLRRSRLDGRSALLLLAAAGAMGGGLLSLALGVQCFVDGDGDAGCAVLTVVVPGLTLPLAAGLAILAAGFQGWLVVKPEEEEEPLAASQLSKTAGDHG